MTVRSHRGPIKGRGTAENPPNRFDRLTYEDDPDAYDPESPGPATQYLRDASKTIIATNQSPDVGFDASINPYRGCVHGCSYCLGPDTPVLFADWVWRPIGEVEVGDILIGFDEFPESGKTRKYRLAEVRDVWWSRRPTVRLATAHGDVMTTENHRWLESRGSRWTCTHRLDGGRVLRRLEVTCDQGFREDYQLGYVVGLSLGDGTFRYQPGWRSDKLGYPPAYWRVALNDDEPLHRLVHYLAAMGVEAQIRPFDGGPSSRKPLQKVEVRALSRLRAIHNILFSEVDSTDYRRGFLAGFFDAEGSGGDSLRITQVDLAVLDRVRRYAALLGFDFRLEVREEHASTIRMTGRLADRIRFYSLCRPAIRRKTRAPIGTEMNLDPAAIEAAEKGPVRDVVDITTSTGTFFAAGLATHNCFARPTHEYLGFSAGVDFESKIMVKEDAPALLRRELESPRWQPQTLGLSGVTDPYQPIERKLSITRGCLEVLAEFRNPVAVITKNHLVTRDADLLAELARHHAAAVFVSVTTLRPELQKVLEPRASPPSQRLRAIETLARAGIPVGALVAPVIPALTDHEVPAILEAVARAGAGFASYVMLRLPYGVKDLFARWLEDHAPERKEKVLARIREIRDGKLNDPGFGSRMRGSGAFAEEVAALFKIGCRRAGIPDERPKLSTSAFRRPGGAQLPLL